MSVIEYTVKELVSVGLWLCYFGGALAMLSFISMLKYDMVLYGYQSVILGSTMMLCGIIIACFNKDLTDSVI